MSHESTNQTFTPGPTPNSVLAAGGRILTAPEAWIILPPGDAALTRRVKAAGDHWVVVEKNGRKVFSRGVWAPAATIERIRADLYAERSTKGFAKKKDADARRREEVQAEYVEVSWGRWSSSWAFMRTTPILPSDWPRPSRITQRRSEVGQLQGRNEFRSSIGPRLP